MSEHESSSDKPRSIGLKAIRDARIDRAARRGRVPAKAWLYGLGAVVVAAAGAWLFRERSLDNQKEELLAKQRAAVATVGAEWSPLRDKIEGATLEAAGAYQGDVIDPAATTWDFRSAKGIYLRLRVDDAQDAQTIRTSAAESARDSFVGCLLRADNPSAAAAARGEADAGSGWEDQPWNLRLAYFATRIFTDAWVADVKGAPDEIHLRVFAQQYDKATREELPLTVDIVKEAELFLLVLDEDVPEAMELVADGGALTQQELQQVAHPVRVHLIDLRSGKEMVRLRRSVEADFRFASEQRVRDPRVLAAMKRQVNNCALAEEVSSAIERTRDATDAGAAE